MLMDTIPTPTPPSPVFAKPKEKTYFDFLLDLLNSNTEIGKKYQADLQNQLLALDMRIYQYELALYAFVEQQKIEEQSQLREYEEIDWEKKIMEQISQVLTGGEKKLEKLEDFFTKPSLSTEESKLIDDIKDLTNQFVHLNQQAQKIYQAAKTNGKEQSRKLANGRVQNILNDPQPGQPLTMTDARGNSINLSNETNQQQIADLTREKSVAETCAYNPSMQERYENLSSEQRDSMSANLSKFNRLMGTLLLGVRSLNVEKEEMSSESEIKGSTKDIVKTLAAQAKKWDESPLTKVSEDEKNAAKKQNIELNNNLIAQKNALTAINDKTQALKTLSQKPTPQPPGSHPRTF